MKYSKIILFFILPIIFLYLGLIVSSEIGAYHLFTSDPEYAYLLNGLNILNFHFPDHVMGPGTPLQLYCAIVIQIVHLFRGNTSLNVDVLQNPDLYLYYINLSIIVLTSIVIFFTGYFVYKSSNNNYFTGLFIQLTAFSSWLTYDLMRRIMVENLVFIGVLILIVLIFKYLKYSSDKDKLFDKYVIWFSVVIGFIAATKLMYLSIAIIPFILINGYKKKAMYVLLSIVSFFIFGFAIINRWNAFYSWYWDNFIHSGQYGNGESTIIDPNVFINNLTLIFTSDCIFLKSFIFILISIIIYHLPILKVKQKNDNYYKALIGIFISNVIMILLVAKQFKYYYMITAILLQIPAILLIFLIFSRNLTTRLKLIIFSPIILFFLYFIYNGTKHSIIDRPWFEERKKQYLKSMQYATDNFKNQTILILPNYYGTPFKEYGLFFGMGWCGDKMGKIYATDLKKLYPKIYFYHDWHKNFYHWGDIYNFIDLLKKYKTVILFSNNQELENQLYEKLHGINRQLDTKYTLIAEFEAPKEKYYKVEFDSSRSISKNPIFCDAENVDNTGNYFLNNLGLLFGNGSTKTDEKAFSGKSSGKAYKNNEYTLSCILSEVKANEHYIITVWRNNNTNAGIVLDCPNKNFYQFYTEVKESLKGWDKIEIDFIVPEILNGENIKIYCWNPEKNTPTYFDDLSIKKIE
jgi:hypothetical protein